MDTNSTEPVDPNIQAELQYLFDTAARHILKQGAPAIGADGICCYETAAGLQCAAAPFILDRSLRTFEGSWATLCSHIKRDDQCGGPPLAGRVHAFALEHIDFVVKLQHCHDRAARLDDFMGWYLSSMEGLARKYDLSTAVFNEPQQVAA